MTNRPIYSSVHANIQRYNYSVDVPESVIQCIVQATQGLQVDLDGMTPGQQRAAYRLVVLTAIQNAECTAGLDVEVNGSAPNGTVWQPQAELWYAHPFLPGASGQELVVTTHRSDLNVWITCDINTLRIY